MDNASTGSPCFISPDGQQEAERWMPVFGFKGYEVSSRGRVRCWNPRNRCAADPASPRVLSTPKCRRGRPCVRLWNNGKPTSFNVHTLVARAFMGPRPEGMIVCHTNGNPSDNRIENLRYDTYRANYADAVKHGTSTRGSVQGKAKLTEASVFRMRERYASGECTQQELASEYGVAFSVVSAVVRGASWAHVGGPRSVGVDMRAKRSAS